jgi:hypothetical protein
MVTSYHLEPGCCQLCLRLLPGHHFPSRSLRCCQEILLRLLLDHHLRSLHHLQWDMGIPLIHLIQM